MYRETTGPQGTTTVTVCVCTHERPCARTTTLVHAQRVSVCVTRKQRERKKREGRVCLTESCAYWVMCACMGARERAPGRSCACVCRLCANAAARKKVRAFLHVRGSARPQIHRLSVCMRACAFVPPPPLPHLVSVASSSSGQISGLWRRCPPGSRCTAPASYRGSSAAGGGSAGAGAAPSPAASGGSTRWRWPLPCLRRNEHSPVSVRVSSLFGCVHRRGRSADAARHETSGLPGITAPYFSHGAGKVQNEHTPPRYSISSVIIILRVVGFGPPAGGIPVRHVSPAAVNERLLQPIQPDPVCQFLSPWFNKKKNQNGGENKKKEHNASESDSSLLKTSVCIPPTEARRARAAASCSELRETTESYRAHHRKEGRSPFKVQTRRDPSLSNSFYWL